MTNFSQLNRRLDSIIQNFTDLSDIPEVTAEEFVQMMMGDMQDMINDPQAYLTGQKTAKPHIFRIKGGSNTRSFEINRSGSTEVSKYPSDSPFAGNPFEDPNTSKEERAEYLNNLFNNGKVLSDAVEKVQENSNPDTPLAEVVETLTPEERQEAAEQIADNAGVQVDKVASNPLNYGLIGTVIATLLGLSIVGISKLRERKRKQKNSANTKV